MAFISDPQIDVNSSLTIGGPKTVEVTYTVHFSLLERLLAAEGMRFSERIHLQEVDNPPDSNDYLTSFSAELIPAEEIADAPDSGLTRTRTQTFSNLEVTGPDDDFSPFVERIRACIFLSPWPQGAASVNSTERCTPYEVVDVTPAFFERVRTEEES